jgi:hypothetical protein
MAILPENPNTTKNAILKLYQDSNHPRDYLGASAVGEACERKLWYSFRWVVREKFEPRMMRLFQTGYLEEARVVNELKKIGCEVLEKDENGKQWGFVDLGGLFRGSCDGVVLGIPEAPKTWHLLEVKTSSTKAFKEMQKKGVIAARAQHYAQMQIYMHYLELTRAMYICVCKETDDLHIERIEYNKEVALSLISKAERIINSEQPPERIKNANPEFPPCSWCAANSLCHQLTESIPENRNCRNCCFLSLSTKEIKCDKHQRLLTIDEQRVGCSNHVFIPQIMPLELIDVLQNGKEISIKYKSRIDGKEWYDNEKVTCGDKFCETPF